MVADLTRPLPPEGDTAGSAPASGPGVGTLVGRYVLLEELGRGGEGRVFAAFDTELERKVALKLLRSEASADHARREARALAKLDHPAVVSIFDVGVAGVDDQPYIAMELMVPEPFDAWAAGASPAEILGALRRVATGIHAAHEAGLVHGDIKPSNILRSARGETKLSDFGVARAVDEGTGGEVGTRAFMAPELFEGGAAGPRSDQYSFCVTAWQLFHGTHPRASFPSRAATHPASGSSGSAVEGTGGQTEPMTSVPPWSASAPSRAVRDALLRGLDPDPGARWPSMQDLERALRPPARRSRGWAVAATALSLGALGLGFAGRADDPDVCAHSGLALDALWPATARARVRDALEAPGFGPLGDRAVRSLDAWAERWRDDVSASCRATHLERSQSAALLDLRGGCYREALAGFRATVDTLGEVDDDTRGHAHEVLDTLPELDSCQDIAELTAAPALDDETRAELEAIRADFARADALQRAGRGPEALELLDARAEAVDALALPRLHMESLAVRATVLATLNDLAQAAGSAEAALHLALQHDDNHQVDDALILLTSLVGHELSSQAKADVYAGMLQARTERTGLGAGDRGAALAALALHRVGAGDYETAITMFEQALDARSTERGEDLEYAVILSALAMTQGYANRPQEARRSYERVLAVRTELLGETHPLIAFTLDGIAQQLRTQDAPLEALALAERARDILLASAPDDYASLSANANNRGQALARLGRMDEAKIAFEAAVADQRRAAPDGSRGLAILQMNLAKLYAEEFDAFGDAVALGAEALRLHVEIVGARHVELVVARAHYGQLLGRAGRVDEARTQLHTAIDQGTELLGAAHPDTLYASLALAALELNAQQWATSERVALAAVEALQRDPQTPPDMLDAARALLDDAKARRPRSPAR